MDELIKKLKTPKECEIFAINAVRKGRDDLAMSAKHRKVELHAEAYGASTEVERECLEVVFAYEEVLSQKNGKRTRASRTWPMIERHGVIAATERAVDRIDGTSAFNALSQAGLGNYAFEAVVLRHPTHFSVGAVERCRKRIADTATNSL